MIGALVRRLLEDRGGRGDTATPGALDRADLVVVADGGSTDGTLDALAELTRIFPGALHVQRGPAGRGAQLRAGAELALSLGLAPADLVLFVHADNRPEPGALAALRAAAEAEPDAEAFCFRQHVEGEGEFYRSVERFAERRVARGRVYGDSCLGVRAGAYRAVGGFRPLPLFEDLDLSRRLFRRRPIRLVEGAVVRVDARRWKREGRTVTVVRNWLVTRGFELGLSPRLLARFYPRHSRPAP